MCFGLGRAPLRPEPGDGTRKSGKEQSGQDPTRVGQSAEPLLSPPPSLTEKPFAPPQSLRNDEA
jgi:hypothetical protein